MEPTYANNWSDMAQPCNMDLWVMKWRSAWPIFHSPMILSYILKTIWCMYFFFGSMNQYDPMFDLKISVGHCDLHSMVQWFCLISWKLFDVWTIFGIMSQYDPKFDLKINIGHCELYFMVQWFCFISWRPFDVCTSYFGSMNQYDKTFDLKINVGHCDIYSMVQWFCLISWRLFELWWINCIIFELKLLTVWKQNCSMIRSTLCYPLMCYVSNKARKKNKCADCIPTDSVWRLLTVNFFFHIFKKIFTKQNINLWSDIKNSKSSKFAEKVSTFSFFHCTHLPITRMRNGDQYRMSIWGVFCLPLEESKMHTFSRL